MNNWQSNLMVSLVGTDLGAALGEEQWLTLRFTDWLRTSGKIQFSVQPLFANSNYHRVTSSYGKEFSSFHPSCRSCSCSPIPSSATSVPRISSVSNESCYGHTNHAMLKKANPITSPLQGHNHTFEFWAHLQVWARLLKEIWMPH